MICCQAPLLWATENGYQSAFKLLLRAGSDLKPADKTIGQISLSLAAENGHEANSKIFLEAGADPESKDRIWPEADVMGCRECKKDFEPLLQKNTDIALRRTFAVQFYYSCAEF
jgi:hypothetical protein